MKSPLLKLAVACFTLFSFNARTAVLYVDASSAHPVSPYTNWTTAATDIQSAVTAAAAAGDLILVTNGVYQTGGTIMAGTTNRVTISGKTLIIQSVNGPATTVIKGYQVPGTTNGAGSVRCVYLASGAMLSGFTITNGSTTGFGGGIYCQSSSAIVSNCTVTGNSCSSDGGGCYSGTYKNCIISGNIAFFNGGGNSGGSFANSLLANNSARSEGGGVYYGGTMVNCTVAGNNAGSDGGGVYYATLANCIVYFNNSPYGSNIFNTSYVTNCCTFPTNNFYGVNITNPPVFVNQAGGDFHLQPWSPGINAGNNAFITNATDLDGNARVVSGTVDIGAYELQGQVRFVNASNTTPLSPFANWPAAATNIQDAVDGSVAGDFIVVSNGLYNYGGRAVYGAATNRVAVDKAVTVQSVNGPNATIIAGKFSFAAEIGIRDVYLTNGAMLSGFTLTNGGSHLSGDGVKEQSGGGVWCEAGNAVVSNCVIAHGTATQFGGGAFRGTLINCTLTNNSAAYGGGAASNNLFGCALTGNASAYQNYNYGGGANGCIMSNCLVVGNQSVGGGGFGAGAAFSSLNNCVISNNVAGASGGGLLGGAASGCLISSNRASVYSGGACSNTVDHCILANNRATIGGGGGYAGSLDNCLLVGNFAGGGGGGTGAGAAFCDLNTCTVVSNAATAGGGGAAYCTLNNCIVFYNLGALVFNSDNHYSSALNFCCTTPMPASGAGNITNEPAFLNLTGADFHLQTNSPCINAGNNSYAAGARDLDNNPRIAGGTVDLGAYEIQNPASVISYAWLQQYGLPTDGTADSLDSDGDGFNTWQEWRAGTVPTNALSLLQMFPPTRTNNSPGVTVSWQSVSGVNYFVQRGNDLSAQPPLSILQSNIVGQAGSTSYTDTTATNGISYFYRVGVQ